MEKRLDQAQKMQCHEAVIDVSITFICFVPGRLAQSVTCLETDVSLTTDPGVTSLILARPHTFVEI